MASVHLPRQHYFPGNSVSFSLTINQQFNNVSYLCANVYAVIFQEVDKLGSKKRGIMSERHRTVELINMDVHVPLQSSSVHPGEVYSGSFLLPPFSIPSVERSDCRIRYYVRPKIYSNDVPGGIYLPLQGAPLIVVIPMSIQNWQQPSLRVEERQEEIKGAGCCAGSGTVKARISLAKSIIALDRDQAVFDCVLDNTDGKAQIESISFTVKYSGHVHAAFHAIRDMFGEEIGHQHVPFIVLPGESKEMQGVVQLNPRAPGCVVSPIVNINYYCNVFIMLEGGAYLNIDFGNIFVANSVEPGNVWRPDVFQSFAPLTGATQGQAIWFDGANQAEYNFVPQMQSPPSDMVHIGRDQPLSGAGPSVDPGALLNAMQNGFGQQQQPHRQAMIQAQQQMMFNALRGR